MYQKQYLGAKPPDSADPKRWKDRKSLRLEDLMPQIVAGFIRIALAMKAEQEKRVAEQQERQRRAEKLARLEQMVKAEESKVRALTRAAADWARAEQIREFISAARRSAEENRQAVDAERRSATGCCGPSSRRTSWIRSRRVPGLSWIAGASRSRNMLGITAIASRSVPFGSRSRSGEWHS